MSKVSDYNPEYEIAYECGKNFFYSGLDESYYKVENHKNREEELKAFRAGFSEAQKEFNENNYVQNKGIAK